MERIELVVDIREGAGTRSARRLRAKGTIPAVVYGGGSDTIHVSVDGRRLERIVASGSNPIVDLKGPAPAGGKLALITEVQRDPVSHSVLHCDFLTVDTSKRITVSVPLHFTGKPPGVEMGGLLEPVMRELEITCLPLVIPDAIEVDVSGLEIGQALHVRDLTIPADMELEVDAELTVVHVVAPRVEETPAEVVVEGEAAPVAEVAEEKGSGAAGSGS